MPEAGGSAPCEIVHVATVPSTLRAFLPGQVGYMKSKGFSVTAVSSPGEDLECFALTEAVDLHRVAHATTHHASQGCGSAW